MGRRLALPTLHAIPRLRRICVGSHDRWYRCCCRCVPSRATPWALRSRRTTTGNPGTLHSIRHPRLLHPSRWLVRLQRWLMARCRNRNRWHRNQYDTRSINGSNRCHVDNVGPFWKARCGDGRQRITRRPCWCYSRCMGGEWFRSHRHWCLRRSARCFRSGIF